MSDVAGNANFICDQGEHWIRYLQWRDSKDASVKTEPPAVMQIRDPRGKFLYQLDDVSGIQFPAPGDVLLEISDNTTAGFPPGHYYYDLFLFSGSNRVRLLEGNFHVRERVSLPMGASRP
jgi:hypothetical protein